MLLHPPKSKPAPPNLALGRPTQPRFFRIRMLHPTSLQDTPPNRVGRYSRFVVMPAARHVDPLKLTLDSRFRVRLSATLRRCTHKNPYAEERSPHVEDSKSRIRCKEHKIGMASPLASSSNSQQAQLARVLKKYAEQISLLAHRFCRVARLEHNTSGAI